MKLRIDPVDLPEDALVAFPSEGHFGASSVYVASRDVRRFAAELAQDALSGWVDGYLSASDVYWLGWTALDTLVSVLESLDTYASASGDLPSSREVIETPAGPSVLVNVGPGAARARAEGRDPSNYESTDVFFQAEWINGDLAFVTWTQEHPGYQTGDDRVLWLAGSVALGPDAADTVRAMRAEYETRFAPFRNADDRPEAICEILQTLTRS